MSVKLSCMVVKFTNQEWEAAKAEMAKVLKDVAAKRGMVSYSELVQKVNAIKFDPESYAFWRMLGEIRRRSIQRPWLADVLVVHKRGDMEPGKGFYELAKAHGRDTSDLLKCWIAELHKVHAQWSDAAKGSTLP